MACREWVSSIVADRAFRSVKRACYSGLDSVSLRKEVARRTAGVLPGEAYAMSSADPETGLITHIVAEGVAFSHGVEFRDHIYPYIEAGLILDLAHSGQVLATLDASGAEGGSPFHSPYFADLLRRHGYQRELRAVLSTQHAVWGSWCLMREGRNPPFTDREQRLIRRIAPHIARGLRTAALIDFATAPSGRLSAQDRTCVPPGPSVLVLDLSCGIRTCTPAARVHLDDLSDVADRPGLLPLVVYNVVGRLRDLCSGSPAAEEVAPGYARLRAQGRSAGWYRLEASFSEPDASGDSSVVIVIAPLTRADAAPLLARCYGLSPREWEVLKLVAHGHSTRDIAARLGLSPYTVQDHLDHAFDKVGVRGRRPLLAKLFFDLHASRVA